MTSDLYETYLKYQNKTIDEDYIYQIFDILMEKEQDLIPYINNLIITHENDNNLGIYWLEKKIITININNINNHHIACKNILGLQTLKHEIEHARSIKKIENYGHDLETSIILNAYKGYAISHHLCPPLANSFELTNLNYNIANNYEINPGERISNVKSWKYVINLLKNQRTSKDLLIARSMLYYTYTNGYKDNRYYLDCPTFTFLLNTNQLTELKTLINLINKYNYSLDTRLLYGLPISYTEYNKDILKKVKLQKKVKK